LLHAAAVGFFFQALPILGVSESEFADLIDLL
jgi:hypothetical protein